MSNRCAYSVVNVAVGLGLLLFTLSVITNTAFGDAPTSAPSEQATSQPADRALDNTVASRDDPGLKRLQDLKNTGPNTTALLYQMLALVIVICVLGFVCWFLLKKGLPRLRMSGSGKPKHVTVLEATYLNPRQSVHLLQVGTKKLLVAGSRDGLQMLADVSDGFPEQETDDDFQTVLGREKQDKPLEGRQ